MTAPVRLGVLISGGGRTLINLADAIDDGRLPATIAAVISSRGDVEGVARARARGFDVLVAGPPDYASAAARDEAIAARLRSAEVDLVVLAGYLRMLPIDADFVGRVINIHPALLPDFGGRGMYGDRVHRAVLESGRTESGCTVHFVDEEYDRGPIILQRRCPVRPDDDVETLAARVFAEECLALPEAIRLIAEGRVRLEDGEVVRTAATGG